MKQIVPILLLCLALASAVGAEDGIPHDSKIARAMQGRQRLLLNPLDDTSSVATGAWKMKKGNELPAEKRACGRAHQGRRAHLVGCRCDRRFDTLERWRCFGRYGRLVRAGCSRRRCQAAGLGMCHQLHRTTRPRDCPLFAAAGSRVVFLAAA